jgi:lipoyl(octanoyl) transferase
MSTPIIYEHWGLIDYKQAWNKQEELFEQKATHKLDIRNGVAPSSTITNHLIFCQHPHVYTLGKSGKLKHLLLDQDGLEKIGAVFYPINRGGDITYHGPGQIVVYPILDLEQIYTDIHRYLRTLEEAVILTLASYGIAAERYEGYTGVWLDADNPAKARKICAMGVRCSRWITMHGLAFNVNTDLNYFSHIVPCGIDDKQVTSMQQELGSILDIQEVEAILKSHLYRLFDLV